MAYEKVTLEKFFEQLKKVAKELERNQMKIGSAIHRTHPDARTPGKYCVKISRELAELSARAEGYFMDVPLEIEFGKTLFGDKIKINET